MDDKDTLNLPKTAFPMKANLSRLEPEMLAQWDKADIYGRIRQASAGRPLWILHDGPPYANGHIHMGHVLNKVLKDFIVKSQAMLGHARQTSRAGTATDSPSSTRWTRSWASTAPPSTCGGPWIRFEKRWRCREHAARFIDIQREEFRRLGVFGDRANPYRTMEPAYEATIAREFGRFVGRGIVYKGLKPVHSCMHRHRPWLKPRSNTRRRRRRPPT